MVFLEIGALTRCRLQRLLRQNADAIAGSIVLEQGKTLAGQVASQPLELALTLLAQMHTVTCTVVFKWLKMPFLFRTHFWAIRSKVNRLRCALRHKCLHTMPVSRDMDTYVRRVPLGVCAAIAPFNFPA